MASRLAQRGLVILDRDGVINRDSERFVKSTAEFVPLPGSIRAIADLDRAGFTVTVASNQSGLARGLFDRNALKGMHRKLRRLVAAEGGRVDRIVVCPSSCSPLSTSPSEFASNQTRTFDMSELSLPVPLAVSASVRNCTSAELLLSR